MIQNDTAYVIFLSFCWQPWQRSQYSDCPTGWRSRDCGKRFIVLMSSNPAMDSIQIYIQWVPRVLSDVYKLLGRKTEHWRLFSAGAK